MPEISQLRFSHADVVTALLKAQGIHEGRWGLTIDFGFSASNIGRDATDKTAIAPGVIVVIDSIGLRRGQELNEITVDAAEVNPP